MTTRFTLTASADEIEQRFSKISDGQWKPNFNISAGQLVPIVLNEEPRRVVLARFGFIPEWAPHEKIGLKFLNAKAEDLMEIPTLKIAMKYRRCLVIADGFYEWQRIRRGKKPFRIIVKKNRIFGFAGMYTEGKLFPNGMPCLRIYKGTNNKFEYLVPLVYIVSQDKHLLIIKEYREIKIISPEEFLGIIL